MYEITYGPLDWIKKMGYYTRENLYMNGKIYLRSHREQNSFAFLDVSDNNWNNIVLVKAVIENGEEKHNQTRFYTFRGEFDDLYEITSFIYDPSVIVRWYSFDPDENLRNVFQRIVERESQNG